MATRPSRKSNSTLTGTNANDTFTVKHTKITVNGLKGNDIIKINAGANHRVYGGAGNDTITIGKSVSTGLRVYGDDAKSKLTGNDKFNINGGSKNYYYGGKGKDENSAEQGAVDESFPGLVRGDSRIHSVLSKKHAKQIGSDIPSPCAKAQGDQRESGHGPLGIARSFPIRIEIIGHQSLASVKRNGDKDIGKLSILNKSGRVGEEPQEVDSDESQSEDQAQSEEIGDIGELDFRSEDGKQEENKGVEDDTHDGDKHI